MAEARKMTQRFKVPAGGEFATFVIEGGFDLRTFKEHPTFLLLPDGTKLACSYTVDHQFPVGRLVITLPYTAIEMFDEEVA